MNMIHIVNGDAAAGALHAALDVAARNDRIVVSRDDLAVGPLRTIDDSVAPRAAFWQRVRGERFDTVAQDLSAATDSLRQLVGEEGEIVVWHGPNVSDQLLLRRVAFHLRGVPHRLNEVVVPAAEPGADACLATCSLATIAALFASVSPVSLLRGGRLALEWQALKQVDCDVRRLRDNHFEAENFGELDSLIVQKLTDDWRSCTDIAGAVDGAHADLPAWDLLVAWRCRALAQNGQASVAPDGSAVRLPPG
ncbi:DUF1835 domain-containing protein [Chitinasiproducens palmae]|uniref:DUF1835 domain-containing protein n=1 Tax=Chitinasiproducens palmae TaxID=1770053 RepID=A0A1H2PNS0_9BURK|nr:DUF1835 domain-containing protein [Chitinasiproducens palmae]SDV48347.1 Protein of unknown function [Chitinasiproducens palmae]